MANAWARSFFAHLTVEMKGLVLHPKVAVDRIRKEAETVFWHREHALPDKQSKTLNASCCVVLAAYRELRSQGPSTESLDLVRKAVYRTYQKPMRFLARLWLWVIRDPLKRLGGNWWKKQSQRMYGAEMQFDQEETAGSVDLLVRRCAFHQFFVEHGEPELTRLFCGWDRNWMDIVDEPGRGIRTERPTTISTGGDCCRFRIVRVTGDDPLDVRDVVVQSPALGNE